MPSFYYYYYLCIAGCYLLILRDIICCLPLRAVIIVSALWCSVRVLVPIVPFLDNALLLVVSWAVTIESAGWKYFKWYIYFFKKRCDIPFLHYPPGGEGNNFAAGSSYLEYWIRAQRQRKRVPSVEQQGLGTSHSQSFKCLNKANLQTIFKERRFERRWKVGSCHDLPHPGTFS